MQTIVLTILLYVILLVPVRTLTFLIHEAGHFFMFRLFKVTPMWVHIGTGKIWFECNYKGIIFYIHHLPFEDGGLFYPPGHLKKMRLYGALVSIAAGPIIECVFGLIIFSIGWWGMKYGVFHHVFCLLSITVTCDALRQLIPQQTDFIHQGEKLNAQSDGYLLRQKWRARHEPSVVNGN